MGKKLSASEIDGVQYRRAKLWQIILCACNALVGMSVYSLIGMASYTASIGFGIGTAVIGVILTGTRILDGVTDPMLAFLYDKVNTKFGKIRILLIAGFVIEAVALLCMYDWAAGKGLGMVGFILLYVIYVIGYTINNMTAQTIPPLLSNDPRQRPTISVWSTALNYMVPMALTMLYCFRNSAVHTARNFWRRLVKYVCLSRQSELFLCASVSAHTINRRISADLQKNRNH